MKQQHQQALTVLLERIKRDRNEQLKQRQADSNRYDKKAITEEQKFN